MWFLVRLLGGGGGTQESHVATDKVPITAAAAARAVAGPGALYSARNGVGHMSWHTAHGVQVLATGRHAHIEGAVLVLHVVEHHAAALHGGKGHLRGRLTDGTEGT